MVTVVPFSVAVMFVTAVVLKVSLNIKRSPPPAPVSTNLFALFSTTSKLPEVPGCVSVTVPNCVTVPHPPEIWHDVRLKVSADAGKAPSVSIRSEATNQNIPSRTRRVCMLSCAIFSSPEKNAVLYVLGLDLIIILSPFHFHSKYCNKSILRYFSQGIPGARLSWLR